VTNRVRIAVGLVLVGACDGSTAPVVASPPPPPIVPVEPAPSPAPPPAPEPPVPDPLASLRSPPAGLTDLRVAMPGACFAVGYATPSNFTGAVLPGYAAPGAWLLDTPAAAVATVHAGLEERGLAVIVYDAYRPYRATQAMVAWATRTDQVHLLDDGYIARRSRHNHGTTIDLGIADPATCQPVDMGTPWDTLDERSHTRNATGEVLERRLLLKSLMQSAGFEPYSKEWWHFEYPLTGTPARDVPYGASEADEGAWSPPAGWDRPGWVSPGG
jgi:D-alanyl-D-alanine dipeptidase